MPAWGFSGFKGVELGRLLANILFCRPTPAQWYYFTAWQLVRQGFGTAPLLTEKPIWKWRFIYPRNLWEFWFHLSKTRHQAFKENFHPVKTDFSSSVLKVRCLDCC
jgi:hypothetical protein